MGEERVGMHARLYEMAGWGECGWVKQQIGKVLDSSQHGHPAQVGARDTGKANRRGVAAEALGTHLSQSAPRSWTRRTPHQSG